MAVTKEEAALRVRSRAGHPTLVDLPEAVVEHALDRGLREFGRYRAKLAMLQVALTAGQATYTVPAGVLEVDDFWVTGAPVDPVFIEPVIVSPWPASQVGDMFTTHLLQPNRWAIHDARLIGTTLTVLPTPEVAATLVCKALSGPAYADLTDQEGDLVATFGLSEALMYMGLRRNSPLSAVPTPMGRLTLDNGASFILRADALRQEFKEALGAGASGGGVG